LRGVRASDWGTGDEGERGGIDAGDCAVAVGAGESIGAQPCGASGGEGAVEKGEE
jgi:hypothetical protein